ncbi:MAG: acylneuraminate cytidylyltransferase family protein [Kiritimatiellae bacterium]|nr:acylneuraminate cytidylyltransferase family protein [Verrucomicrobiota bacterium]MCG2679509.1 acylneuraminate cytidylyltransferase family protein [Kiritimatiellia bacterium]
MDILHLIVARGGSKSIPGKNLRKLAGISLVGYKAISAKKSRFCTRLMISTDSEAIQQNARSYGVEVPFTRPAELATDTAQTVDVIWHAMEYIEKKGKHTYDAIMLLEPSSPFARSMDIDLAVELMEEKKANLVVGMRPVTIASVFIGPLDTEGRITSIIDKMESLTKLNRQHVQQEYTMNGALYLIRWDYFKQYRHCYKDRLHSYGLIMPWEYSLEIDEPMDLVFADFLIEKGYIDLSNWR